MKNLICILTLSLILLFIVSKKENVMVSAQKENLPQQGVKQFIDFAIEGNEKGVDSLITSQPDSYIYICEDLNNKNNIRDLKLPLITPTDDFLRKANYENILTDESKKKPNDKFSSSSDKNVKNSLAFLEAEFLYATHSVFNHIKILDTIIYQDEATVDVEYIGPGTSISKKKFLLKKAEGWKIFATVSPETLKSTINENYAAPRPPCKLGD